MGINYLWKILAPAAQKTSFSEIAVREGFERNRHGTGVVVVGIDARPELRVLFYRLAALSRLPISAVLVFDGDHRPKIIKLDSDIFLFGATHIMRSPQDSNKRDIVEVYTNEGFARQTNQISPAGFIFIAVMCGGDYDPVGLCGFGRSMAEASGNNLRNYLVTWQLNLEDELLNDPHGALGWTYPHLAHTIPLIINVWDGYFIRQLAQASISCLELPDGTNLGPDTIRHITSVGTKISTSSAFPSYRVEAFLGTLPVDVCQALKPEVFMHGGASIISVSLWVPGPILSAATGKQFSEFTESHYNALFLETSTPR
ncbi:hypothetical protein BYT27DRAFT_7287950 [Phlegmacium glaucopus]|nr:hypothetical protein BYT27DRAFT_7287950 [Phlegmacium glaucopus]